MQTGGGKPDYIPPDDALDRVASILGATCEGYSVSLGGDAEVTVDSEVLSDGGGIMVIDTGVGDGDSELMSVENESGSSGNNQLLVVTTPKPKKFFFNTPSGNISMYLLSVYLQLYILPFKYINSRFFPIGVGKNIYYHSNITKVRSICKMRDFTICI